MVLANGWLINEILKKITGTAPELTDAWFEKADLMQGTKLVRLAGLSIQERKAIVSYPEQTG